MRRDRTIHIAQQSHFSSTALYCTQIICTSCPNEPLIGDPKLQPVTQDAPSCQVELGPESTSSFAMRHVQNSTMEENQRYAIVKPPPHKSWITHFHSDHGARM
eukprot:996692-Amphidinium_carterae.1